MNEFLEAAKSANQDKGPKTGDKDDSSEQRYEKAKKEEAGTTDKDPAKQRYNEIKERAKKEMMKESSEKEDSQEKASKDIEEENILEDEEDDTEEESFITY